MLEECQLGGFVAWLTWSLVHLMLLIDFRSRSSVYLAWSYAWFTRDRIARLARARGIPFVLSSDAHAIRDLANVA